MALTLIQQVRLNVADSEPGLYIISDDEITWLLEKNNNSVPRASLDAARIILLNLAQRGDEVVDIFSIKGKSAAEQYRLALELFIKDPNLNPLIGNLQGYFGGVSRSDMQANNDNCDNNIVENPTKDRYPLSTGPFSVTWRL